MWPLLKPLAEVVSQAYGRGALLTDDSDTLANSVEMRQGGARFGRSGMTGSVFRYVPTKGAEAIGETGSHF